MAFTDEALKAKLSTLNETQDSIVAVSQWIMFHKRHADKIANHWLTRLRDSPPPKRLNFIYLVNDIVQNARARKRSEFPDAFSPLMPEAMQTAYRSSTPEIQGKIRRVLEVWRTRNVFETPIQEAIEARLNEVDKSKGTTGKKTLMGNSLFNSSSGTGMPKELESLAPLQIAVTKATLAARPSIDTAQSEYTKLNDPETTLPSPPVYAARLSSLIKALNTAESSVAASIKARQSLVSEIEKILDVNKAALAKDEETFLDLGSRKTSTEAKKREVEDAIIRGLSSNETDAGADSSFDHGTPDFDDSNNNNGTEVGGQRSTSASSFVNSRPEVEELTPEPEDFSLPADTTGGGISLPTLDSQESNPAVAAALAGFGNIQTHNIGSSEVPSTSHFATAMASAASPTTAIRRPASGSGGHGMNGMSAKRRKMSHGHDEESAVPDLGEMGLEGLVRQGTSSGNVLDDLDADVNELLRQEGARS